MYPTRKYESTASRIEQGRRLAEIPDNIILNKKQCLDLLLYHGFLHSALSTTFKRVLRNVKHETDQNEVIVHLKDFENEVKNIVSKKMKSIENKVKPEINPPQPIVNDREYLVKLSERSKNLLVKMAKNKNTTVQVLIATLVDKKVEEFYRQLEEQLMEDFNFS